MSGAPHKTHFSNKKISIFFAQALLFLVRLCTNNSKTHCLDMITTKSDSRKSSTMYNSNTCHQWNGRRSTHFTYRKGAHSTGTLLPIIFNFNHACNVHAVDQASVKLVERQKYRAPSKQTTRILHHEITLPCTTTNDDSILLLNRHNQIRLVFAEPDRHTLKVRPTASHPHIKIKHWIQIYINYC